MLTATIFHLAADVAALDDELWTLAREERIPSEEQRAKMLREATRYQFICGAARKHEELAEAKMLVSFLRTAPIDVDLSECVVDNSGAFVSA